MTIAEMVYIRNEINHAAEVLHWFKSEGFVYGGVGQAEVLIRSWELKLDFWKNELN
jgi:hypothetical protein